MEDVIRFGVLFGSIACFIGALLIIRRSYAPAAASAVCPFCAYDLAGLSVTAPCPECGQTADARSAAMKVQRRFSTIVRFPLFLWLAAQGVMLLVVAVGTGDPCWALGCAVVSVPPHAVLFGFVYSLRRRLTPRAATTLMACGLLFVTLPLSAACIAIHYPRDAMAGVAVFFAMTLDLLLIPLGMMVGALVIRMEWFKARRCRPPSRASFPD